MTYFAPLRKSCHPQHVLFRWLYERSVVEQSLDDVGHIGADGWANISNLMHQALAVDRADQLTLDVADIV